MYRRDLRDTSHDGLLADMAMADLAVQAAPSPTDGRIAYAQNREDQTDLWLHDGGSDQRLTSEGVMAMRYGRGDQQWLSWAPDGSAVAFLSASGTLSTVDTETGEVEERTHHDGPDIGLAWGEHSIALVTNAISRAALTLVDLETGSLQVLADDDHLYSDPRWGDDGLYAVRARHRDLFDYESALVRVPLEDGHLTGEVETLFHEDGVRVQNPRPHSHGDGVAFVHDATGFDELYYADGPAVEAAAGAQTSVQTQTVHAEAETETADPAWHPDGDRLAATATHQGRVNVRVVTLDGDVEERSEGDEKHSAPFWLDGEVHSVRGTPTQPPQVWNASAGEAAVSSGSVGFEERLAEPTEFTFEQGDHEIHTVVYPPVGGFPEEADSVPLLVHPHGGPTAFDDFGWDYRSQYFAALGYAVAMPNYRGSDGYGRDHRNANDDDWGGGDLDDVIDAADATADAFDAVDGSRAGIFGGSGGGLMTVNALGNSERFDAGAAFYGVYDYETFIDDTDDIGWQLMKRELGDLSTDLENYREASPIRHVPDIEDPVLVLHGEEDARVPMSQSEQLCEELEKHGKRHELQRYEGEPHGFSQRGNVLDAYTRCADLFAKYLGIDPDDGSSHPHPPRE
ncbi:prolyl oligopeptidase family serine peptidase [Halolamina sp.]|jgi:dipeptidyl aminopeptidase/acylaminoacyl peptidase|uniref:S9 family peptidase n=1 Tax=Halolamina sp. TaxID=1940283 RepID=UPI000223BB7C|nr:Acylaminoacyl-peptidase [halophilic archaeon DL31]